MVRHYVLAAESPVKKVEKPSCIELILEVLLQDSGHDMVGFKREFHLKVYN